MARVLVEECQSVSVSDFKGALDRIKRQEGDFDGELVKNKRVVSYWIENNGRETLLTFSVEGSEPQTVVLIESGLTFGLRTYFACPDCGHSIFKLYQLPTGGEFKCRDCHNLSYELSGFNRKSAQGRLNYRASQLIKLANYRELLGNRLIYHGKFTNRYSRYLHRCLALGLDGYVVEARDYLTRVQALAGERQMV